MNAYANNAIHAVRCTLSVTVCIKSLRDTATATTLFNPALSRRRA